MAASDDFDFVSVGAKYIAGADLKGKDVTVAIERVECKVVKSRTGEDEEVPILYFAGSKKGYIPNKTMRKVLAKLYGRSARGLVGKRITLYPVETSIGGEPMVGIRIRPVVPAEEKGAA